MTNLTGSNSMGDGETPPKSSDSTVIVLTPEIVKAWIGIKHFQLTEFDSPDLILSGSRMNLEFIKLLDKLRDKVGFPLHVNSGYRTPEHNAKVAKTEKSAHVAGCAADIAVSNGTERGAIIEAAWGLGIKRIGVAKGFVHLDTNLGKEVPQKVIWTY